MVGPAARLNFADFLDRLAARRASPEEWQSLVVMHYADEVLEDARRRLVRLARGSLSWDDWTPAEREGFQALAAELRRPETA